MTKFMREHLDEEARSKIQDEKRIEWLYYGGYVVLIFVGAALAKFNELRWWVAALMIVPPLAADLLSHFNPWFIAHIYTHRKRLIATFGTVCFLFAALLFCKYPLLPKNPSVPFMGWFMMIVHFFVLGGIAGLVLRMLLINLFADILRARSIHKAKLLIMVAWVIFLIMLPTQHREKASLFIAGTAIGFMFHYAIRNQEKSTVQKERLKKNIKNMIEGLKKGSKHVYEKNEEVEIRITNLTETEEEALELYADQRWKKLEKFLDENEETAILFFIRLSMLRKLHEYEEALELIHEKATDPTVTNKHFLELHAALNESERFDHDGVWKYRGKVFAHIEEAYRLNPNCLLTCATYALRIAGELPSSTTKGTTEAESKELKEKRDLALHLIWQAMKLYEEHPEPKLISAITGFTVPVTYTFLLDTYGYVLLKCGKTKFAIALMYQSLFQDPTFAATYLHLAEWYIDYYGDTQNGKKTNRPWQQAARVNLYIAIEMEKEYDSKNKGTYISETAKQLLKKV